MDAKVIPNTADLINPFCTFDNKYNQIRNRFPDIFAEFRYQTTDQLTNIMNMRFHWNQYTFNLGYMFKH